MERVKSLARLTLVVLWRIPNEEDRRIWSKATTVGALKEQVHGGKHRWPEPDGDASGASSRPPSFRPRRPKGPEGNGPERADIGARCRLNPRAFRTRARRRSPRPVRTTVRIGPL